MLLSQGALTATSTAVVVLLARNLSTYQFGLFVSFLGLAQAFSFVIDAGLSTLLLRECARIRTSERSTARQNADIAHLLHHALVAVASVGSAVIVGSILIGFALGLGSDLALAQGAFMAYVVLLAGATALEAQLRSDRRLVEVVAAGAIEKVALLLLVAVALLLGMNILAVGAAHVTAGALRLWFDHRRSFRSLAKKLPSIQVSAMLPLVRAIAPFALNSSALMLLPRLDTALIATISVIGASYYGLGFQIVTTAALIPSIASITLLPFLVSNPQAKQARWKVSALLGAVGVISCVVGVAVIPTLVPTIFGSGFTEAVGSLQVMMITLPFIFACGPLMSHLYVQNQESRLFRWSIIPSLTGSVAVLAGQAVIGPSGASLGLVLRYALITISVVGLSLQVREPQPRDQRLIAKRQPSPEP